MVGLLDPNKLQPVETLRIRIQPIFTGKREPLISFYRKESTLLLDAQVLGLKLHRFLKCLFPGWLLAAPQVEAAYLLAVPPGRRSIHVDLQAGPLPSQSKCKASLSIYWLTGP